SGDGADPRALIEERSDATQGIGLAEGRQARQYDARAGNHLRWIGADLRRSPTNDAVARGDLDTSAGLQFRDECLRSFFGGDEPVHLHIVAGRQQAGEYVTEVARADDGHLHRSARGITEERGQMRRLWRVLDHLFDGETQRHTEREDGLRIRQLARVFDEAI